MLWGMKRLALLTVLSCLACAGAGGGGGAGSGGTGSAGVGGPGSQGCGPEFVQPDYARLEGQLDAARARWKAAKLQDYRYDFARIAAPLRLPDVTVTVEAGRVSNVVSLDPLEQVPPEGLTVGPVEALFLEITQAITFGRAQPCAALRVSYDAADGHPLTFYSGTRFSPLADGFAEWRVTNFSARP